MTNNEIAAVYYGVDPVSQIYLGAELVWPTIDYLEIPLTFDVVSGGTIVWGTPTTEMKRTIKYSKNGGEKISITSDTGSAAPSISVDAGDTVVFWGNNTRYGYYNYANYCNTFSASTASFKIYGNIMSLLYDDNFSGQTSLPNTQSGGTFRYMFHNCSSLISAENLIFPAQNLLAKCYANMFSNCSNLEKGPTILTDRLTNVTAACQDMFRNCSKLSYMKCLATAISPANNQSVIYGWLSGVAATGTFVKHPNATWESGSSGIPTGWTVIDATI